MPAALTLQEIQNDVAMQMNLPPQETIVESLKRYNRIIADALPHIPYGKDFQVSRRVQGSCFFLTMEKLNPKDSPNLF